MVVQLTLILLWSSPISTLFLSTTHPRKQGLAIADRIPPAPSLFLPRTLTDILHHHATRQQQCFELITTDGHPSSTRNALALRLTRTPSAKRPFSLLNPHQSDESLFHTRLAGLCGNSTLSIAHQWQQPVARVRQYVYAFEPGSSGMRRYSCGQPGHMGMLLPVWLPRTTVYLGNWHL